MSKKRVIRVRNLTAKVASLFLAMIVWFLIQDLLNNQRFAGKPIEEPAILGPAINPDLQGAGETVEPKKETPTVH